MTYELTINFDDEDNLEFDDTKVMIDGGAAKLVPTTSPPESELHCTFEDALQLVARDYSGHYRDGAFQASLDDSAWVPGKIGSGVQFNNAGIINYDDNFSFDIDDAFSIEFWVKFTYGGATILMIASKQRHIAPLEGYHISTGLGKIRFALRDSDDKLILLETPGTYNDGSWHHVVCVYDGDGAVTHIDTKLYVDNVNVGTYISTDKFTGTMVNSVNFQLSGRNGNNAVLTSDFVLDELVVYSRALTPAEIAFRWNLGAGTSTIPGEFTTYPMDNPTVVYKGVVEMQEVLNFVATTVEIGLDLVKYSLIVNSVDYYWDGSAWSVSTSYVESNTAAEILANLSSLALPNSIRVKAYLHSDDGASTPEISVIQFEYNPNPSIDVGTIYECLVYGHVTNAEGEVVPGVSVTAVLTDYSMYASTFIMTKSKVETRTDSNGRWELSLVENASMSGTVGYTFTFKGSGMDISENKVVPNLTTKNYAALEDL